MPLISTFTAEWLHEMHTDCGMHFAGQYYLVICHMQPLASSWWQPPWHWPLYLYILYPYCHSPGLMHHTRRSEIGEIGEIFRTIMTLSRQFKLWSKRGLGVSFHHSPLKMHWRVKWWIQYQYQGSPSDRVSPLQYQLSLSPYLCCPDQRSHKWLQNAHLKSQQPFILCNETLWPSLNLFVKLINC